MTELHTKNEGYTFYNDYDFCKSIECYAFDVKENKCDLAGCIKTAKEFHKWLILNGYKIVKYKQNESQKPFKAMRIVTTVGVVSFIGRYRRDLEAANWHYYETEKGDILHFRKEHMVAVLEDENESFTAFEC